MNNRTRSAPTSARRSVRPSIEALEIRDLLSSTPAGSLLVQLKPGAAANWNQWLGGQAQVQDTGIAGLYQINGDSAALDWFLQNAGGSASIQYAESIQTIQLELAPNDPKYQDGTLWGLSGINGIKAPTAWDSTTGSTKVIIADIDTGVDYTHADLYKNIWINQAEIPSAHKANLTDVDGDGFITFWDLNNSVNQGNGKISDVNGNGRIDGGDILAAYNSDGSGGWADGIDQDPTVNGVSYNMKDDLIGWDYVNNDNNPYDDHTHGTHTVGTFAAIGNNATGVAGINWQAQVIALKFLSGSGSGSDLNGAKAIRYAADHGARVSNNSWGGGGGGSTLSSAISYAGSLNHIFVAAAGNNGSNTDVSGHYPSSYSHSNIISVASTTSSGGLSSFSNYGKVTVDLGAAGSSIYSTVPGGYGTKSGTSMATPHVTGVVALVIAQNPTWTASQVISQVLNTTTPLASLNGKTVTGGLLNAAGAVTPQTTPPAAPVSLSANPASATSIQLNWTDVGGETGYEVERSANGSSGWSRIATPAANSTSYTDTGLTAGVTYYYRVRGVNAYGNGNYSPVASAAPTAVGDGLAATYYDNMDFTGPTVTRVDANINFNWGQGSPSPSIGSGTFSARWTGQVMAKYSESYKFHTVSDDGVRLWVNNQLIVDNWTVHAATENSGTITLVAGQKYDIRLEFFENTVDAVMKLSWSSASQAKEIIPQSHLYSNSSPSAPAAPDNLTASATGSGRIDLIWRDNGYNETGYQVERSTDGATFTKIADLAAGATTYGDSGLTNGTAYYYRVRAVNGVGNSGYSGTANAMAAAVSNGLVGSYYENSDFTGLFGTRLDGTVNFNWGTGAAISGMGVDTFSVRWVGQVQPAYSQSYTFYTNANNGVRLWVNGQQIINNWSNPTTTQNSGTITLAAGQKYDIKLEYFENLDVAVMQLSWSSASQSKQIIPQSRLFNNYSGTTQAVRADAAAAYFGSNHLNQFAAKANAQAPTAKFVGSLAKAIAVKQDESGRGYTSPNERLALKASDALNDCLEELGLDLGRWA